MKVINLSNVKIKNQNIEFEFLYKSAKISNNLSIYLEDKLKKKYFCDIKQCKNKVYYSYYQEECFIAKIIVNLPVKEYGKLKIILKEDNQLTQLTIKNNKNEWISEKQNPYILFTSFYQIQILQDSINVEKKKIGDIFKYELKKQIYGLKKYKRLFVFRLLKAKNRKYYLFNDRLLYGDDNAEELFKYINETHPKFAKNCYFVIDKKSLSRKRIQKIGKILIDKSFRHKLKFLNSKMILSSHSSYLGNCFNPFNIEEMEMYKDKIQKKFVFLQHGVIMNDVRQYLNRELTTADLFITSTKKEYEYIKSDDFMYEPNMVVATGLPRFDKLKENQSSKVILISPTWRVLKEEIAFKDTKIFETFQNLLSNKILKNLLETHGYKIKFLLHPVFTKYKELFHKLSYESIEILESSKIKYCELFNECAIFITDYSSIHYDVAFLKKPIIYYQFDREYFFKHHYQHGYFDYEKDGFGKVVETQKELIDEIQWYLNNHCKIRNNYKERIEHTFIHLDCNNSKRVFEKMIELDNREEVNYRFNNVH